jgi:hypothetical protein
MRRDDHSHATHSENAVNPILSGDDIALTRASNGVNAHGVLDVRAFGYLMEGKEAFPSSAHADPTVRARSPSLAWLEGAPSFDETKNAPTNARAAAALSADDAAEVAEIAK